MLALHRPLKLLLFAIDCPVYVLFDFIPFPLTYDNCHKRYPYSANGSVRAKNGGCKPPLREATSRVRAPVPYRSANDRTVFAQSLRVISHAVGISLSVRTDIP